MSCSAELRRSLPTASDGAFVIFVGQTRETPGTPAPGEEAAAARHAGEPVSALEYEAYDEMALDVLREISAEIEQRFGVRRLAIVHRTGRVPLGEPSVVVAAAAAHRSAAFDAARYAIDELKARAPIWKSEQFADGSVWIGDRRSVAGAGRGGGWCAVYLSVDMEGMAGVSHAAPTRRGDDLYAQAVELMTGETNAAIEGAFAGGATEVTVNDSHGQMFNLPPEKLDERARLVEGKKPLSMVEGARDIEIRCRPVRRLPRAGRPSGGRHRAHLQPDASRWSRLNGRPATEAAVNALYLGALGRAGRTGHRRRCAGRRGRRLAA